MTQYQKGMMSQLSDKAEVSLTQEKFVKLQFELLELEKQAELDQSHSLLANFGPRELANRGVGIHGLTIESSRTGLYGRCVITLKSKGQEDKPLPSHSVSVGDIVAFYNPSSNIEPTSSGGIVLKVTGFSIDLSFDSNEPELNEQDENGVCRIVKLANDITYRRLRGALDFLKRDSGNSVITNCLFGLSHFSPPLQSLPKEISIENEIQFLNVGLDKTQKEAVRFAILQRELAIIHGPPGTGKTTTLVEVISQLVRSGLKILCCAPSNVAVDNLLERLVNNKVRSVRLGHPARVNQDLQKYSLDALLNTSEATKIVQDVRKDIDSALQRLKKSRSKPERFGVSKDLKELRKELHVRERNAMKEILTHTDVVLSTLTSVSQDGPLKNLGLDYFDVLVIDECSQSLEMACWIAIPFAKKIILAGDHQQLPPTIMSKEAAGKGLEVTLMERIIKNLECSADLVRMLSIQYRMHEKIMAWSSSSFYHKKLEADESVKHHLLKDLNGIESNEDTDIPLLTIDTSGCDMFEMETPDEISKANEGEVGLVCLHVESLIKSGLNPQDIAVIAPYNLQVELIRLQLRSKYPNLEIRSVDGFQGREKEAVVLSLVRSNEKGEVGFLAESRRLNVAVTRGRRHVAVICNMDTVKHDRFLKTFMDYLEEEGEIRSAMQYQKELEAQETFRPDGMVLTIKDGSERSSGAQKKKVQNVTKKNVTKTAKEKQKEKKLPAAAEPSASKIATHENDDDEENQRAKDALKREQFEKEIDEFLKSSSKTELNFSPKLNSHDRLLVHEIAESLDLIHESAGNGKNRFIRVREKLSKISNKKTNPDENSSSRSETSCITESSTEKKCSKCHICVPSANLELHLLRCTNPIQASVKIRPIKEKKKTKPTKETKSEEDDFDQVLANFTRDDKVCNVEKCKARVAVLGVNCGFCTRRFCLSHGIPEAHGCEKEARLEARKQIGQDKKLYPGSGRPDKKIDPVKHKQIQLKMKKKLNSLAEERKVKKNEDK